MSAIRSENNNICVTIIQDLAIVIITPVAVAEMTVE